MTLYEGKKNNGGNNERRSSIRIEDGSPLPEAGCTGLLAIEWVGSDLFDFTGHGSGRPNRFRFELGEGDGDVLYIM